MRSSGTGRVAPGQRLKASQDFEQGGAVERGQPGEQAGGQERHVASDRRARRARPRRVRERRARRRADGRGSSGSTRITGTSTAGSRRVRFAPRPVLRARPPRRPRADRRAAAARELGARLRPAEAASPAPGEDRGEDFEFGHGASVASTLGAMAGRTLVEVEDARARILAATGPPAGESVALGPPALGRVLGEDVVATHPVPAFDNSAMDGFAVRAARPRPAPTPRTRSRCVSSASRARAARRRPRWARARRSRSRRAR